MSPVFLYSFSCDKHFYPGWPIFPAAEMSLFKLSCCFEPIYHAFLPRLEIPAFQIILFSSLACAAAAKKIVRTPEALLKILEEIPI